VLARYAGYPMEARYSSTNTSDTPLDQVTSISLLLFDWIVKVVLGKLLSEILRSRTILVVFIVFVLCGIQVVKY
jgi:hypothetical protein